MLFGRPLVATHIRIEDFLFHSSKLFNGCITAGCRAGVHVKCDTWFEAKFTVATLLQNASMRPWFCLHVQVQLSSKGSPRQDFSMAISNAKTVSLTMHVTVQTNQMFQWRLVNELESQKPFWEKLRSYSQSLHLQVSVSFEMSHYGSNTSLPLCLTK